MVSSPPHDTEAEAAMLGLALSRPEVAAEIGKALAPDDFYRPDNRALWAGFLDLMREGTKVDVVMLHDRAKMHGFNGTVADVLKLSTTAWYSAANKDHVELLIRHRVGRELLRECAETMQALHEREDPYELSQGLSAHLGTLAVPQKEPKAISFEEFQGITRPASRWVVPNIITDDAMAIIIAEEGLGKATLMRQIGMCAAQGVHPFSRTDIPPVTVLYIDLENPDENILHPLTQLQQTLMRRQADYTPLRFRIWHERAGINILNRRDLAAFERELAVFHPKLVMIGPMSKMYRRDNSRDNYEDMADRVIDRLAYLRDKYKFGLFLEHHMPKAREKGHRVGDPLGSQRWMGTPDFGLRLVADPDTPWEAPDILVERYRRDRFAVQWPRRLIRDHHWNFSARY